MCQGQRVLVPRKATREESIARAGLLNQSSKKIMMAVVNWPLLGSRVITPEMIRESSSPTATVSGLQPSLLRWVRLRNLASGAGCWCVHRGLCAGQVTGRALPGIQFPN